MSESEEKALMLAFTLKYHKGKTTEQLKKDVQWLQTISLMGIDHYLKYGEDKGYIYSRVKKNDSNLYYYSTKKGQRTYDKYFQ